MQLIWYTALSMDGRIADGQDSLDWLEAIGPYEGSGTEFHAFLATIDAAVVGASTLRWLLRGGHGWPHGDLPTWLVSHDPGLVDRVGPTEAPFTRVEGNLEPVFEAIAAAGHRRVWLCGGGDLAVPDSGEPTMNSPPTAAVASAIGAPSTLLSCMASIRVTVR
jgi:dihydrofolate reductase